MRMNLIDHTSSLRDNDLHFRPHYALMYQPQFICKVIRE